ncbi:beta-ketoacyl synthase N-terminal-like domain-containing protein [Kribbella sp. NPDC050820]|uniref:beta-ketoacyl synthase N-terminal-like domain-containing protein n=1 Tax=Kribbella sp. NPDC050820 TaxID=3155408 RepID=UPI0033EE51DA
MTALEVLGVGTVGDIGAGKEPVRSISAAELAARWEDAPFPPGTAYSAVDLDVRRQLGRKGTGFFDRRTALTVLAARTAFGAAGIDLDSIDRSRAGVILGTTAGSIQSSVEYSVATFTQHPPHLVNPGLFPNTVMNGAAGQAAIWFGLTGVNATVAGGPMAFLSVLHYATSLFETDQADLLVAGVIDELTPVSAWVSYRSEASGDIDEGGALFVLRAAREDRASRPWVSGVAIGFAPSSASRIDALGRCALRALSDAGASITEVGSVVGLTAEQRAEAAATSTWSWLVDPGLAEPDVNLADSNQLARPARQLIALSELLSSPAAGAVVRPFGLLFASSVEGAVGCAVLRGATWHS